MTKEQWQENDRKNTYPNAGTDGIVHVFTIGGRVALLPRQGLHRPEEVGNCHRRKPGVFRLHLLREVPKEFDAAVSGIGAHLVDASGDL